MATYQLLMERILGNACFSEIGKPSGIYWSADKSLLAIASSFDWLQWSGREIDTKSKSKLKFKNRLCVYHADTLKLVGVVDGIEFPINSVSFHPNNHILAIGTGSYDGGYFFKGKLLIWDIQTDEVHSHFNESREVTQCKFSEDGETLYIVIRPEYDGVVDGLDLQYDYYTYGTANYFEKVSVDTLSILDMETTGIHQPYDKQELKDVYKELTSLASPLFPMYENRGYIWDVLINDREIVSVCDNRLIEKWTTEGNRIRKVEGINEGRAVEIAGDLHGNSFWINVEVKKRKVGGYSWHSVLFHWDGMSDTLQKAVEREFTFSITHTNTGQLFARDVGYYRGKGPSRDFIVDKTFETSDALDLGYYSLFNTYLNIKGADDYYFVQGTPKSSHEDKWLCRLNPLTKEYSRLFPLEWDITRNAHLFSDGGCYCRDSQGEALILAARIYHSHTKEEDSFIMRRDLQNGDLLWEQTFKSQVTAMTWIQKYNLVIFALADGKIGVLSALNGQMMSLTDCIINGVNSMVISLDSKDDKIVGGTIDGRILLFTIQASYEKFFGFHNRNETTV
ncbi:WD40 repeat domain-containing protein [Microbacteriaceae bacterium 4G12]